MATTISDNVDKIQVVVGENTYDVKKSDIKSVSLNHTGGSVSIRLAAGYIDGNHLIIDHGDVSSPTFPGAHGLFGRIMEWWREPGSRSAKFIAEAGDTVFDCTPRIGLKSDSQVFVDGEKYFGEYTISVIDNTVTFDDEMVGYEEIEIVQ